MLRRRFAFRLFNVAWTLAVALSAQAAEPFPGKSPIGAAERAPSAPDMFQGKLKPVPELVMRDELEARPSIPFHPDGYDEIEKRIGPMRKNKERTHSGIWKHVNVYFGYTRFYGYYASDENLISDATAVERWRVDRPQAPEPPRPRQRPPVRR